MAFTALPILFYNLGGEMLYVLDQRLLAQKIPIDKSEKVICDIIGNMYNVDTYKEIAKPQALYTKPAMRTIFTKLVHSSIMKVNADSMDKLFDLMTMAVKYQVTVCSTPLEILHITLNHLDACLSYVSKNAAITAKVKNIFLSVVDMYNGMSPGEFILLRQALLAFLQDSNNKVSIYLNQKKQNEEGRFIIKRNGEVPQGSDVPGRIQLFKPGKQSTSSFNNGSNFVDCSLIYNISNDIGGIRCTTLGTNIYKDSNNSGCVLAEENRGLGTSSSRLATAELGLLAQMIGSNTSSSNQKEFKLSLFSNNDILLPVASPPPPAFAAGSNVLKITATKSGHEQLSQIVDDLTINSSSQTTSREDLLSLMDS